MELLHVMFLNMYFFPRKLDSCASFLSWSLTSRKGTCIFKVISRARDSFEINSSSKNFWWIERRCIKNLVKNKQVGSFQKFSRSNASCTMYIVFNARHWDCFDNFFPPEFQFFFLLNFISLIVFINATRPLYNINFIFFN